MRILRFRNIALAVLVIIIASAFWLFTPLHHSARRGALYGQAYVAGVVRIKPLLDKPFSSIVSALPGNYSVLNNIPVFVRPLIPPVIEIYLQKDKNNSEWALAADLGWRSRLFRMLHGVIIGQMQFRGMGAIEDNYILRTPSGKKLLFFQDGRTLFLAEGSNIIDKIMKAGSKGGVIERIDIQKTDTALNDKRIIISISFSNIDGHITEGIAMMESRAGFLLLPSAGSLIKGAIDVRQVGGETIAGTISLSVNEEGDSEGLEVDIRYIIDLLERFLSARNLKTDSTIITDKGKITVQIMIHPDGDKK